MISSLSSNAYVNDILHQPDSLRDTINEFGDLRFKEIHQFAERITANSLKRVVLTGMGSSYHALHPIFLTLTEHGIQSQMIETSELIHFAPRLLSPETLVIAVSQSGRSAEILQLLELAGRQVPIIGITNTPESPLAQIAESVMITRAGFEYSVSCKTYVTTLAALVVLGDLLTGHELDATISALEITVSAMDQYLSNWETYTESVLQITDGIHYLIVTGRGPSLAAVGTSSLIIKEAARFPAEGMSCAAFRHGPLEMVSPEIFVLVYEGIGVAGKLNANLVRDIQKAGGRSELVIADNKSYIYNLPTVPNICLPLVEILPAQLTSIALAMKNNHTPGQFQRAAKTTIVE